MSFPCGNCGGNCTTGCVFCENCEVWFHYSCEKLQKKQFNEISKKKNNACDYICSKCTKTPEGTYDFDKSLKRLGNYAKNGNLEAGASLETVLLRSENLTPITNRKDLVYSANLIADRVSEQILASLNMSVARRTPIYVSGDGNCLYNAISVGICGNESLSAEIRVRTCLELIKNRHAYRNAPNSRELFFVSPNYDDAVTSSACKGKFACAWEMQAAATVIGRPIQSVYPPRNGLLDKAIGILNTVFTPLSSKSKKEPLLIMWSNAVFSFVGSWLPNHFVPLVDTKSDSILDIYDVDAFPPLNSTVNESCSACPTIFDETPILRNQEVYDCTDTEIAMSESATLSDSADHAAVSEAAKHATVSGTAKHATVSGTAKHATVSGTAKHATVSGTAKHAPVSGTAKHAPVSGTAKHAPVSGKTKRAKLSLRSKRTTVSVSAKSATVSGSANIANESGSVNIANESECSMHATGSESSINATLSGSAESVNLSETAEILSPSENGTGIQSPHLHFGSPIETFNSLQESVESFDANPSVLLADNTISDSETSEILESKSPTEKSLDSQFSQHFTNLSENKFIDTNKIIAKLSSFSENEVLQEMPKCKKENVYFLLDNSENIVKKEKGFNMEFWDNCGTWASKSFDLLHG